MRPIRQTIGRAVGLILSLGVFSGTSLGVFSATASHAAATPAPVPPAPVPRIALRECRLQHPLRLGSIAGRCGTLRLAEDPSRSSPTIELNLAVIPALNRRSREVPLFILAGGPGQSAISMYVGLSGAFSRINRDHDIVLLDQRGTGKSSPLNCDYPENWQHSNDSTVELREATAACLEKYGTRVQFYTTSVAVQDLDQVRRALGYAQINLYGASYGTRVAQLYMRRFPEHVHAVILDGVTYPEQAIGADTPLDGEAALQKIVSRCHAATDCRVAYPKLSDELASLERRFGPENLSIVINDPDTGLPQSMIFNRSVFGAALRFLSYSATQSALLPTLIHQAAIGNVAPLAAQTLMTARQLKDQLASGMQNTVICSEDQPLAATLIDREKLAHTYQGLDQLDALAEICKLWPKGPVDSDLHASLHSEIPTLLLSGDADPVTPPRDADLAARGLVHHRHIVLSGEGHGQLATGCMPKVMAAFIESANVEKLDATCLEIHQPPAFFNSTTGPSP